MKNTVKKLFNKETVVTAVAVAALGALCYVAGKEITETNLDKALWEIAAEGGSKNVYLKNGETWVLSFVKK